METIEILALASAVLIIVKTLVNLINPKWSIKKARNIMKNESLLTGIYVVFAAVLGYIVISAVGIVNVFATIIFGASLMGISFMTYPKQMLKIAKAIRKDRKKIILALIIWVALALWTLYALYAKYIMI